MTKDASTPFESPTGHCWPTHEAKILETFDTDGGPIPNRMTHILVAFFSPRSSDEGLDF